MKRTITILALAASAVVGLSACDPVETTEGTTPPAASQDDTKSESPKATMTKSQENAVEAAQNYLSLMAFSRDGLIEQLSSDAGDGYSKKDATFAVDSLHIDFNKQAVKAAKNYLDTMPFSCKDLTEQLDSSAGDGYTHAQAVYGASKSGVC
jgi:predicted 3-demethylubiquinone-9 3-methyltransferase (glyoxalase superfamily)